MADLRLVRAGFRWDATHGVLVVTATETAFAVTLEPERDNNRPSTGSGAARVAGACIPAGRYLCRRIISPKFGETFEITNVPGRSHVLFHAGNRDDDTEGCVLIGHGFDPVGGEDGIVQSKKEFAEFLRLQQNVPAFWLDIIDAV